MKLSKGQLWALPILLVLGGVVIGFGFGREFLPDPEIVEVHHTDTIIQWVEYDEHSNIMALNWQFFKTDTIAAQCETPTAVYDDVILIRKFYYRGGPK